MTFANRMVEARKKLGLTQSEVAERLNVSFQAVSLWERGESAPEVSKLADIADLYQISLDWLLTGKKEERVSIDSQDSLSDRLFNEKHMYTYVKTYANAKGMLSVIEAIMHQG